MIAIDFRDYNNIPELRVLAKRLARQANVNVTDCALIEQTDTGWRFKIYARRNGKKFVNAMGAPAHRWVHLRTASP